MKNKRGLWIAYIIAIAILNLIALLIIALIEFIVVSRVPTMFSSIDRFLGSYLVGYLILFIMNFNILEDKLQD